MIVSRRKLIGMGAAGAGGLLLGGCDRLNGSDHFRSALSGAEALTMRSQRLMMGDALAREFTEADMSPHFRVNGSSRIADSTYRRLLAAGFAGWTLKVDGLVHRPLALGLDALKAMPQRSQITRHDCVEGWSAIGQWTGVQLSRILTAAGVKASARYIVFRCADRIGDALYYESCDMVDARHPQTIMAWALNDAVVPIANGAPLRLRIERQLGYKHAKYVTGIEAVASLDGIGAGKGGYWEDRIDYEWYAGI